jgi:hypothetical protein
MVISREDIDITTAIECVVALYWIFGICYPKQLKHTMSYLETYIFGLNKKPTVKCADNNCFIRKVIYVENFIF